MSEQENNEPITIQGKQSQQRTHVHCQKKGQYNFVERCRFNHYFQVWPM